MSLILDRILSDPETIVTSANLREYTLIFEFAPASPKFDEIQAAGPGNYMSDIVFKTVTEIEKAVDEICSEFSLEKSKYKFLPGIDRVVSECAGLITAPWIVKFLIVNRIIRKGFIYLQSEEISSLDLLLEPFQDTGQRYRVDIQLTGPLIFTTIQDRSLNIDFDPRELFDMGSAEYDTRRRTISNIDYSQIITDLGGIDRATAVHFCRMRLARGKYDLHDAKNDIEFLRRTTKN